ncbi:pectin lyase fold/virulence factor [Infundibulicybe gibba]|nr:pectin lyase fold/virulence factor [Infundibulicybe gibba]
MLLFASLAFVLSICQAVIAASRTTPPSGAIIVRAGTKTAGEFASVSAAISSLPNDSSSRSIFIFPGTYTGQVYITRAGPLTIYGYTTDTSTYNGNQVTIQAGVGASTTISDDASGTLRAIAISQYGSRVGLYACGFYGYQDTLYANQGTQVYLKSYIQGATDFIFGRLGYACFNRNTIVYLGRPWGGLVIFKSTVVTAPLNHALWSVWNTGDERTSNILFAEYNTTGSGQLRTVLSASQAAAYSISSAVGSDYASWVDAAYIV